MERFIDRFYQPITERVIAIIIADNKEMLDELILLRDLMDDVSILLVLPDGKEETISNGLRLYPRFVTDVEGDFLDLVSVLDKLIHRNLNEKAAEMK